MATLFVDKIDPQSGTTLSLGSSGDTLQATAGTTNNLGISEADQWRLTASTNQGTSADVTTNWERVDTDGYSSIGTGLTESSGIFSFSSTGIYFIHFTGRMTVTAGDTTASVLLKTTEDNVSYSTAMTASAGNSGTSAIAQTASGSFMFNVTNTSTHKFKFTTSSFSSSTDLNGNSGDNRTHFTVIRLGDT